MVICRFPFFSYSFLFFPIRQRYRQHRHAPRSYTAPDAAMTRATTPCRARRCALPRPRGRGATAERANGCPACDAANPRSNVSNSLPHRRAPTSRSDVAPNPRPRRRARPKRASARRATCRGPPVPTPRAPRSAPMLRNLSFLATEPRSGAKTVGAFATIRRRPGVSLAKASTSVEIGGKTLPARTRTRFRGHKSPLLLHGATQKPPTATPPGIEASARGEKGQGRRRRAPSHRDRRMRQRRHIPTRARIRAIMTRAPDSAPRAEPLALAPLQERAK